MSNLIHAGLSALLSRVPALGGEDLRILARQADDLHRASIALADIGVLDPTERQANLIRKNDLDEAVLDREERIRESTERLIAQHAPDLGLDPVANAGAGEELIEIAIDNMLRVAGAIASTDDPEVLVDVQVDEQDAERISIDDIEVEASARRLRVGDRAYDIADMIALGIEGGLRFMTNDETIVQISLASATNPAKAA